MSLKAALKWGDVGPVFITVAGNGVVNDTQWRAMAADLQAKPVRKFLAAVAAPEVSSVQRKLVVDILKARKITSVIVSDDAFVRGMITAAGWVGADIRGFNWANLSDAIDAVAEDRLTQGRVADMIRSFKLACDINR